MENNQLFYGTPVLSLITNFSKSGDFERVYMVMGRELPSRPARNQMRQAEPAPSRNGWNGPLQHNR